MYIVLDKDLFVKLFSIDRFRFIIIYFSNQYIEKFLPSGKSKLKDIINDLCDGDLSNCEGNVYIGDETEYAVEIFLNIYVRRLLLEKHNILIPEFQVTEEEGYGLPEYSLYWNYDARSWCGRWTFNDYQLHDLETQLCYRLCRNNKEIEIVEKIIEDIECEKQRLNYVLAIHI